jgi:hypothetical protein
MSCAAVEKFETLVLGSKYFNPFQTKPHNGGTLVAAIILMDDDEHEVKNTQRESLL